MGDWSCGQEAQTQPRNREPIKCYGQYCSSPWAFADYTTGAERLESEHELSMEYETPHTKWAKPYAQGTTRVLYICPYYQGSTEGREIIELMQRFDLAADVIY